MRYTTEHNNGPQIRQLSNTLCKKIAAEPDFVTNRLVLRGNAPYGIRDHAVAQFQPVIWIGCIGSNREPEFFQRRIEQITGVIARERTPRLVCSLQSRRQSNDQEPGVGIAE